MPLEREPYLHRPEVKGQEEEHGDKAAHKAPAEPVTAHIGDDGAHSEEQVEEGCQGVPRENLELRPKDKACLGRIHNSDSRTRSLNSLGHHSFLGGSSQSSGNSTVHIYQHSSK